MGKYTVRKTSPVSKQLNYVYGVPETNILAIAGAIALNAGLVQVFDEEDVSETPLDRYQIKKILDSSVASFLI